MYKNISSEKQYFYVFGRCILVEEWQVQDILAERYNDELEQREFKVRWVGYSLDDFTWESMINEKVWTN